MRYLFLCQSGVFSVESNDFSVLSNDFPADSERRARVLAGWGEDGWMEDGWMEDGGPIINKRYHIFLKQPNHSQSRAEKAIQRLDEVHAYLN